MPSRARKTTATHPAPASAPSPERGPAAAPLDPPPAPTTPVAPPVGARQPVPRVTGEAELIGEDGEPLKGDDLFTDQGDDLTYVVARQRIYQRGAVPHTSRLLVAAGAPVSRREATRLIALANKPG